ncbi:hypothetical protein NT239_01010 [Chitinibacter sp. SCUT-21]|uniref:hypothetical protein n=1 Tax=Chitinibacter sp. SCUT-21 TaxID=2970891 RepID=UPI0035A580E2
MPINSNPNYDELSAAIAQYLQSANEVVKRVDLVLQAELSKSANSNLMPIAA